MKSTIRTLFRGNYSRFPLMRRFNSQKSNERAPEGPLKFPWKAFAAFSVFSLSILEVYRRIKNSQKKMIEEAKVPGESTSVKKQSLEVGSKTFQTFPPLQDIHFHLCGAHGYSGDMQGQVEAHHFCHHINEDFAQCVIYDSNKPSAKLIGIEYVISKRLYENLPEEEKKLWHSHVNEVKGGSLTAPSVPVKAEREFMKEFVGTYGKTFHTWRVDQHNFPFGIPQLMMAFTKNEQISDKMVHQLEVNTGRKMEDIMKERQDIQEPPVHPSADSWEKGDAVQLTTHSIPSH